MKTVTLSAAFLVLAAAGAASASDRPVEAGLRGPSAPLAVEARAVPAGDPFLGLPEIGAADLAAAGVELGPAAPVGPYVAPMGAQDEVILNYDTRMRLATALYPNRAVVLITRNGNHHCTGFLISSNTVATAGHCVHTGRGGAFYDRRTLRVWPGRDGTTAPHGSCGVVRLHTVQGWSRDGNRDFDYGAMRLDCSVGNATGWFGLYHRAGSFLNEPAIITGYPGDKPQTQWVDADKVRESLTRQVRYRMDTVGGNSGSPIWSDRDNALATTGVWAYAIHTFGDTANNRNGGTRIAQAVLKNYQNWINRP